VRPGRKPSRYKVTATDDHGKTVTTSTNDQNRAAAWLMWHYAQGHDVEIEDREAEITLRGV